MHDFNERLSRNLCDNQRQIEISRVMVAESLQLCERIANSTAELVLLLELRVLLEEFPSANLVRQAEVQVNLMRILSEYIAAPVEVQISPLRSAK